MELKSIIKQLFGTKYQRDLQPVLPILEEIIGTKATNLLVDRLKNPKKYNAAGGKDSQFREDDYKGLKYLSGDKPGFYVKIDALSDDELRERTRAIRANLMAIKEEYEVQIRFIEYFLEQNGLIPQNAGEEETADGGQPAPKQNLGREKTLSLLMEGFFAKEGKKTEGLEKKISEKFGEKGIPVGEGELSLDTKEVLAKMSDTLYDDEVKRLDEQLFKDLPEVYAIVRSTARRFKDNTDIVVTATDFDRDLAAAGKDFVDIDGDKAVWHNHWVAGGNEITWDMEHYDVQLVGGIFLNGHLESKQFKDLSGIVAEMATGEGKTLVATLPVFLNALAGNGVHVVTVNDYLSKRDSEWMGPIYQFHGLSVDCIDKHEPNSDARKRAYNCDITFGTNNEFGFDYLRDNMAIRWDDRVQRKHHNFAIVDEVDSVLIDDARTPLIISGPVEKTENDKQFEDFKPYVEALYQKQRALVNTILNEAKRAIAAGDESVGCVEIKKGPDGQYLYDEDGNPVVAGGKDGGATLLYRAHKALPKYPPLIKFLSEPGMKVLMQKAENFFMQDNDREMWRATRTLYFVINEQQNTVDLTDNGHAELAKRVSDPQFFVLPNIGEAVAEIARKNLTEEEKEQEREKVQQDYALKSDRVHTMIQLLKAYAMFQKEVDYVIIDGKVKIVDESTGRIMEGRRWSDGLHQAIEAKENVQVEATTQTYATITLQNYFRMYHKLSGMTGTAETEAGEFAEIYKLDVITIPTYRPVIRNDQNDVIYKTKKAKYAAVIDKVAELVEAGRPVLVGTTDVETSELLSRMMRLRGIKHNVLNAKEHAREADIVREAGQSGKVTIATNMAGRGTDIKLTPEVKEAGGLAIVGTERHDSRRVDRQLRGRSGRQGDPGSSIFFISLEDKLMRLFGSERIAGIVDKLGMRDDEALENSMLSKSIERAQRRVEENHFGTRKHLVEYDDVMSRQRETIYQRRRNALQGQKLDIDIDNMMLDMSAMIVSEALGEDSKAYREYEDRHNFHRGSGNVAPEDAAYQAFREYVLAHLSLDVALTADEFASMHENELSELLYQQIKAGYVDHMEQIVRRVSPVIKNVYETKGSMYENIAIPITDGRKLLNLSVNLQKAYETHSREVASQLTRRLILIQIDQHWKQHLRDMDDLRQSVQNARYEQKDPLVVYKHESYELFSTMLEEMYMDTLSFLLRSEIALQQRAPERAQQPRRTDMSQLRTNDPSKMVTNGPQAAKGPVVAQPKVGRNDPCPCGSGLKYKNCHGKGIV